MSQEVGGTISTFGQQILSTKPTSPKAKIGTGTRTIKIGEDQFTWRNFGVTSNGVSTNVQSGFGLQASSNNQSNPSIRFGSKYASDNDMAKESRPGPGAYNSSESAIGKQGQSAKPTAPTWKVSDGNRFGHFKSQFKEAFMTPSANSWRPASGWLGDAPQHTFHGTGKRADITNGLPGNKPTSSDDPGPGTYAVNSAFGPQTDSRKESVPRTRVGTANRDVMARNQYISEEHGKHSLLGKHSPAPNCYMPQCSVTSQVPAASAFKFGSSDRFSQIKSRTGPRDMPILTPGPGTYVI